MKKNFWPIFSRIIECGKTQGTIYECPRCKLTNFVENRRSFHWDLRGCWKQKLLKKSNLSSEEKILAYFPRINDCDKSQGTIWKGPKRIMTITVEVTRPILQDAGGCWKHKVLKKKAMFPVKKSFWSIFSRIIEQDKRQGTIYKGPQGNLLITLEFIRPFLQDPRGCWKRKFLKKKAIFPVKKSF